MTDEDRLYERLLVLRSQTGDDGALTELIRTGLRPDPVRASMTELG
jgi:hypothetical protein